MHLFSWIHPVSLHILSSYTSSSPFVFYELVAHAVQALPYRHAVHLFSTRKELHQQPLFILGNNE